MFSVAPVITDTGKTLLLRAAAGEAFTFTKFQAGSGELGPGETPQSMRALKAVEIANIPITEAEDTAEQGFIQLTAEFDNQSAVQEAFRWTELGLIAEDAQHNEYLYAYACDVEYAQLLTPGGGSVSVEQAISCVIAVGDTDNITAYVIPHSTYALQADFQAHLDDTNNPHHVTAEQLGAAEENHTHSANDITSGILPLARGGTGVNTLEALKNLLSLEYSIGIYEGDGALRKNINLGFKPSSVVIIQLLQSNAMTQVNIWEPVDERDNRVNLYEHTCAVYIAPGLNYIHHGCDVAYYGSASADVMLAVGHGGAAVTDTGFAVGYYKETRVVNRQGFRYLYIAWR